VVGVKRRRQVGLIMVGDELLDGRTPEGNSRYLIERLRIRRAPVGSIRIVPDRLEAIRAALEAAHRESVAVVVSGGLGPTPDDITRQALAAFVAEELILDESLVEALEARYRSMGREMARSNLRQAFRTPSGRPIENPRGTAPGLLHLHEGVPLILLPGVPAELMAMWEETAEAVVLPLVEGSMPPVLRLRTARLAESDAADLVRDARIDSSEAEATFCVTRFGVDIVLRAKREEVALRRIANSLIGRLGARLYAIGDRGLDEVLVEALARRGETLAVAESCTGGMLGSAITDVPGSSRVFLGGVIAYSNAVKATQLGVDETILREKGAVSAETARAMAEGVRERLASTWALAVTGIAGPGGGTPEKPVGTVYVGLSGPGAARCERLHLPGDRRQNRQWSVAAALDLLRRELKTPVADASASPGPGA